MSNMDNAVRIAELERRLREAEARISEVTSEAEARISEAVSEAQAQVSEAQARAIEERARADEFQRLLHTAERRAEGTESTLGEFLVDCHHVARRLPIRLRPSDTGLGTKVHGRLYPRRLLEWTEFPQQHGIILDSVQQFFGEKQLFPGPSLSINFENHFSRYPVGNESDIIQFAALAVEFPMSLIFAAFGHVDPEAAAERFGVTEMRFSRSERVLNQVTGQQLPIDQPPVEQPSIDEMDGVETTTSNIGAPSYPDGLVYCRRNPASEELMAFCFDYKAAHRLLAEDLERVLKSEALFLNVVRRINSNKTSTDEDEKLEQLAETRAAMALVQVFHYMIVRGLQYGYVTAGKTFVLLHIDPQDTQTLYYHLCVAKDRPVTVAAGETPMSKLISFSLLSFQSEPVGGRQVERLAEGLQHWPHPYDDAECTDSTTSPSSSQEEGANPTSADSSFDGGRDLGEDLERREQPMRLARKIAEEAAAARKAARERRRCKDQQQAARGGGENTDDSSEDDKDSGNNKGTSRRAISPNDMSNPGGRGTKRKDRPSSGSSYDNVGAEGSSSDDERFPTRQFCTQACLLGLKLGRTLDDKCPNVSAHRAAAAAAATASANNNRNTDCHGLGASEFLSKIHTQLTNNVYWDCAPVDPYGLKGGIGTCGALFKVELSGYGYTCAAKGTQAYHRRRLEHEGRIYDRLISLQGVVIPVHLGLVDVTTTPYHPTEPGGGTTTKNTHQQGYFLPGGARVTHFMLLSHAGEPYYDAAEHIPQSELDQHESRSVAAITREGIQHGDIRTSNLFWNAECHGCFVIDFDRAGFVPPAKHKRVEMLVSGGGSARNKRRRRSRSGSVGGSGKKRKGGGDGDKKRQTASSLQEVVSGDA